MRRRRQDLPRQRAPTGLLPCLPPPRLDLTKVEPYNDVLLRLVSYPDEIDVPFRSHQSKKGVGRPNAMEYGITRFDLVAGNNPDLAPVAACIGSFIGFHEFANFTVEDVGMAKKGLSIPWCSSTTCRPFCCRSTSTCMAPTWQLTTGSHDSTTYGLCVQRIVHWCSPVTSRS
jgi:hypothetical protein